MNAMELTNFLKENVDLFKSVSEDKLNMLVTSSRVVTFQPNELIVEFGEEVLFLGVVIEGEAEGSIIDDKGNNYPILSFKRGDIFGEYSLMTGDRAIGNIAGLTICKVLLIPQSIFTSVMMTHQPAIQYLSKLLTQCLQKWFSITGSPDITAQTVKHKKDPYGLKLKSEFPVILLIINCGSSSLKYKLFDTADEAKEVFGQVEKIGSQGTRHVFNSGNGQVIRELPKGDHSSAFNAVVDELKTILNSTDDITAVGHRVVHGGEKFTRPELITDNVLSELEKLSILAPLHNPVNIIGIKESKRVFPNAYQIAVFDTTFHHTLPPYAYLYGLPYELYEQKHIRRYGFHGNSHFYVALKAAEFLKRPFSELEIISCHLGNGASMCAVDHGRSVDTSMGLTPVEGLIMGTRCGNIDPGVIVYLMRLGELNAEQIDTLINKQSGLKGMSGLSNDMREIESQAQQGNHRALLAYRTFCYQIRKYIGAYVAAMEGLDVVIFTGGIGQGSAGVRSMVCQRLNYMGIEIDEEKNKSAEGFKTITDISRDGTPVRILVIPTDEERMIARQTLNVLQMQNISELIHANRHQIPIPIEISAHHVHLAQEHVEALFGPGHKLTPESDLSQPKQFASIEKVNLIGPKGRVERVRVLGPARKETQVEIAMTEQFKLGIHPPIRESGQLDHTPGVTLEGSYGKVTIDKGVICALRHIHIPPEDALRLGLKDRYKVQIRIEGERELIFGDVLVRANPNYRLAMHLDTDEGNAADIKTGMVGYIVDIQSKN
jgi:acetate kinase